MTVSPHDEPTVELPLDVIRAYLALQELFAAPTPTWDDALELARMTGDGEE